MKLDFPIPDKIAKRTTTPAELAEVADNELVPASTVWSTDAVRIAEHIRHSLSHRPATLMIGGLESNNNSAQIALEVSQALAVLGTEPTLLLEIQPSSLATLVDRKRMNSVLPELRPFKVSSMTSTRSKLPKTPSIQSLIKDGALKREAVTQLQKNFHYSYFDTTRGAHPSDWVSSETIDTIKRCNDIFPLTVIHSIPFTEQESYALSARADFIVVVVTQGTSHTAPLLKLQQQCQAITQAPLGVVMAKP